MSVVTSVQVSEMLRQNRFSAEFFDPQYDFEPTDDTDWPELGSVLKQVQYGLSIAMNDDAIGVPILRMNELDLGFVKTAARYADISEAERLRYLVEPGDVLFNRTNAFNMVGRTGLAAVSPGAVFASYLIRLRPDARRILPEYLAAYLNTPFGISQVRRRAMRSINQANVSGSEIRKVRIPLLPKALQIEIAELLHRSHGAISDAEQKHSQAVDMLNNLYPEIVGRDGNCSVVSFHDIISDRRFDSEFYAPRSLSLASGIATAPGSARLTSLANSLPANTNPHNSPDEQFRYVELADIDSRTGTIGSAERRAGSDLPSRARRKVDAGDVIASTVLGSLNKVAYVDEMNQDTIVSTGFFHLRPRTCSGHFLIALMKSRWVRDQLQRYGNGGILSAVPDDALGRILVPAFSHDVMEAVSVLGKEGQSSINAGRALFDEAVQLTQKAIEDRLSPTYSSTDSVRGK